MMDQREDQQQRHSQQQPWRSDDHDESLSLVSSSSSVVADDNAPPLREQPCNKRISVPPASKAHGYALVLLRVVAIGAIAGILIVRREDSFPGTLRTTKATGYVRPNKLFGYVHIAKAGGTNLNSLFANVFERVCGNKGYSFESYRENEVAKHLGNGYPVESFNGGMKSVGFEDCCQPPERRSLCSTSRQSMYRMHNDFSSRGHGKMAHLGISIAATSVESNKYKRHVAFVEEYLLIILATSTQNAMHWRRGERTSSLTLRS